MSILYVVKVIGKEEVYEYEFGNLPHATEFISMEKQPCTKMTSTASWLVFSIQMLVSGTALSVILLITMKSEILPSIC